MRERRSARIGTVSGLALLVGGTAVAAVAGGAHSIFATVLLGLLSAGMAHALLEEIRRQARRESPGGWGRHDTINAVLLATWAIGALITAVLVVNPTTVRAVGLTLTLGYALSCAHFVAERRRTIAVPRTTDPNNNPAQPTPTLPSPAQPSAARPRPGQLTTAQPKSGQPESGDREAAQPQAANPGTA